MDDEERSLLINRAASTTDSQLGSHHDQFCRLVGIRPLNCPRESPYHPHPQSLYVRATSRRKDQSCTYMVTASVINTLMLTQIVLGAALTGLGASNSGRILITIFGALNTVIAGVIAFLKSRGQPMRARMFRDDLSRVVDEIENSAVMWYGISHGAHGYGAIDTDEEVTVRGEVARLTRLYDKAVKSNTINDPDMYNAHSNGDSFSAGLRKNGAGAMVPTGPTIDTALVGSNFAPGAQPAPLAAGNADDSPASKPPESKQKSDTGSDKGSLKHELGKIAQDAPVQTALSPASEDAEPAAQSKPSGNATSTSPAADTSRAPSPVHDSARPDAGDKTFASVAAAASSAPTLTRINDPDESPASAAAPPRGITSHKTI